MKPLANLPTDPGQLLFLSSLIGNEKHIDLIERIDCLYGHVVWVARANSDDEHFAFHWGTREARR